MLVLQLVEHSDDSHPSTYRSHRGLVYVFWWDTILGSDAIKNHDDGRGVTDIVISQPAFISV